MHAEGQTVAGGVDRGDDLIQRLRLPAHDMQHGTEDLLGQRFRPIKLDDMRGEEIAVRRHLPGIADLLAPLHLGDMAFQHRLLLFVDDGTDVGGDFQRIAEVELARRTFDHLQHAVGNVFLQIEDAQRRAALAGRAEGGEHHVVGDLFGKRRRIDDHRVQTAGFGNQRHDRAVLGSKRPVDRLGGRRRPGEGNAGKLRMGGDRGTDIAGSGQQHQHVFGHARLVEEFHRLKRDQRRLWRRFGNDRIAGDQRCRNLAEEDGEREIPRRDAGKHAAAPPRETVELTRRAGHDLGLAELATRFGRIVAAEIDRLADFGDTVVQRLAGFEGKQRQETVAIGLHQIGHLVERGGTLRDGTP